MFEKLTIIVEIPENNLYFNTNLIGVIMNSIIFFQLIILAVNSLCFELFVWKRN